VSDKGKQGPGPMPRGPAPEDLVRGFLAGARERGIAIYLIYGYTAVDGRAKLAIAANVDPAAVGSLKTWLLGLDDQQLGQTTAAVAQKIQERLLTHASDSSELARAAVEVIKDRALGGTRAPTVIV